MTSPVGARFGGYLRLGLPLAIMISVFAVLLRHIASAAAGSTRMACFVGSNADATDSDSLLASSTTRQTAV